MAVGNTLASFPATVTPFLALWLKRLTGMSIDEFVNLSLQRAPFFVNVLAVVNIGRVIGFHAAGSWIPLFSLAAAVQLLAAVMYGKHISLNAARDELVATHEVRNPTF
eukprot:SAG31_NODE_752_length_12351_cov_14.467516_1_plen_108_part_00